MAKELKCPNCGAGAVEKEGGGLVCPACGGTFTFREGEARLEGIGEYERLKGKVDQIEAHQAEIDALLGKPPDPTDDPPEDPAKPGQEPDDDEDDDEDW